MRPKAYSYIRMSTDVQRKGDSLRRQLEASRRYAAANDLELVEDFRLEDLGVSAFKGANVTSGALGQFLAAVREGRIEKGSYLIVELLDRLSRQAVMESFTLFAEIMRAGVNIATLTDNQIYKAGEHGFSAARLLTHGDEPGQRGVADEEHAGRRRLGKQAQARRVTQAHRNLPSVANAVG